MAKMYKKFNLTENERGQLIMFNTCLITFIAKATDENGNPVLKCFDEWGNYAYIKGSDAYRYSYQYDKYVGSMSNLYRFKSRCLEMDRLQARQIRDYANRNNLSIEESAKALADDKGNIWKYSPDTVRMAMIPSVWTRERSEFHG